MNWMVDLASLLQGTKPDPPLLSPQPEIFRIHTVTTDHDLQHLTELPFLRNHKLSTLYKPELTTVNT